jgi:predicted molibdopterin-dependent oxidoreductase YjgC
MSPDRAPNFRGARDMGVVSNGGFAALMNNLAVGSYASAFVVGEDLLGANGARESLRSALQNLSFLVVQETRLSDTARLAHVVLPAVHFAEKEGTYTNRQGRVQKLNAALIAPEGALQDSEIFLRLLAALGAPLDCSSPSDIFAALTREIAGYAGLDYDSIGEQGRALVSGGGGES